MGFVDLPGTRTASRSTARSTRTNLYLEHKKSWMTTTMALEDGRRDLGEENGMTCSQCHIRNFGMHDYHDPANVDPSAGVPKAPNHSIATTELPDRADRGVVGVHARVPEAPGVPRQADVRAIHRRRRRQGTHLPAREVKKLPVVEVPKTQTGSGWQAFTDGGTAPRWVIAARVVMVLAFAATIPTMLEHRASATAWCGRCASRRCRSSG